MRRGNAISRSYSWFMLHCNRCNRYLCMHVPIEGLIKANTLRTMCGCKREWNWNWIRNSNRNRLWRNRGRTPRVINVVVVVYGVLLTAGKNCTRVFPGNLFFARDLRHEPISVRRSRHRRRALRCTAPVRTLSLDYCQFLQFKVQQ